MAPRLPNLALMDFFLWGAMKDVVYNSKLRSLDDLKRLLRRSLMQLTQTRSYAPVCESVVSRMTKSNEQNGWQFEHLSQSFILVVVLSINLWNH